MGFPKLFLTFSNLLPDITDSEAASTSSSSCAIKKVNSKVNIDEKTGKVVSTSTSNNCDLAANIALDDELRAQKIHMLQNSNSSPDLESQSPTSTNSSNSSNNQSIRHGKHVILAVESTEDVGMNQIGNAGDGDHVKQKIKLNIDLASNGSSSSSSTSSNNLEYGNESISNTNTL